MQSWQQWRSKEHWRWATHSLISSAQTDQDQCVASSLEDLGLYEGWLNNPTVTTSSARAFKTLDKKYFWMPVGTIRRLSSSFLIILFFLCFIVSLSDVIVTLHYGWIIPALLRYTDEWNETFSCSFLTRLKATDEKGQHVFWIQTDWQWKTVRLCLFFFQTWWIFCWTLRELCLKKQVWERGLFSPNPLNISILARHPMPACCWHIDWRTLACIPIILCKQPTVSPCTSTFPFPPLFLKKISI